MRKFLAVAVVTAFGLLSASAASAATVVVTPENQQGWSTADTRPGGSVTFVADASAPGAGALQLTTDATTTAKAQYMHAASTPLSLVTDLSYDTKQNVGPAHAEPAYQLLVCLNGVSGTACADGSFTTLVYEPYQNGVVIPGAWQTWDVDAGQFWSSRSYAESGGCGVTAGGGGAPFYTLAGLQADCPGAVVVGFGVNIGSNNPSYNVETDLVQFNTTTYDFEPYVEATAKDQCKDGGWKDVKRANGSSFKNQGDCVQYVNTGK